MQRVEATAAPDVVIHFKGRALAARRGESVAAALLAGGQWVLRTTPVTGGARGPFCMMGVCFDCLVDIDGAPNQQACMVEVREGMRVEPQSGAAGIGPARAGNDG